MGESLLLLIAAGVAFLWVGVALLLVVFKSGFKLSSTAEAIGRHGESIVARRLKRLSSDEYFVLHDLMISDKHGMTTQIDHVVISRFGLFVIETKCYKGWIFGNEKSRYWTQSLYAGGRGWFASSEKHKFQNPIKQNWRHIYVLSERLNLPVSFFFNVVVFSGDSTFKTPMPDNVMDENDVVAYIESFDGALLNADRTLQIFGEIAKLALPVSEDRHQNHVGMLNANHIPAIVTDDTESIPRCPRCGATMRLRHRHSDGAPFYGCSNYPQCRGIVNIVQA